MASCGFLDHQISYRRLIIGVLTYPSRDGCINKVHSVDHFKSSTSAKSTIHSLVDAFRLESNSPEDAKVLLPSDFPVHCERRLSNMRNSSLVLEM